MERTRLESKTIEGFSVTYEKRGERTFAVSRCPVCFDMMESCMNEGEVDAGLVTALKIKKHLEREHPKL